MSRECGRRDPTERETEEQKKMQPEFFFQGRHRPRIQAAGRRGVEGFFRASREARGGRSLVRSRGAFPTRGCGEDSEPLSGSWPLLSRTTTPVVRATCLQPRTPTVRRAHEPALVRRSLAAGLKLRPVPTRSRPAPHYLPPLNHIHSPLVPAQVPPPQSPTPAQSVHFHQAPPTPRKTPPTPPSPARPRPHPALLPLGPAQAPPPPRLPRAR